MRSSSQNKDISGEGDITASVGASNNDIAAKEAQATSEETKIAIEQKWHELKVCSKLSWGVA
jgi:hypothetical protein